MFFNYFKDYFLKKKLKNSLSNAEVIPSNNKVQTIGILVDERSFLQTLALKEALIEHNFLEKNISIVVFRDPFKVKELNEYPTFGWEHINWSFQIQEALLLDFVKHPFDVLLSYYDTNNGFLQWITSQSKASFKVGFFSVDKRLNHILINTQTMNYKEFVQEFVRVLQLFNKI
ncbi:DUF6913 domain-containing protein [Flavobacterium polysaccharolyticum]|uniref:Uncharacterized protein n=1 Tax=Flavobacterium polysaccharolyticum TaxID=3133148 RepID=A0ABU9NQY5_9FLAO